MHLSHINVYDLDIYQKYKYSWLPFHCVHNLYFALQIQSYTLTTSMLSFLYQKIIYALVY